MRFKFRVVELTGSAAGVALPFQLERWENGRWVFQWVYHSEKEARTAAELTINPAKRYVVAEFEVEEEETVR